MTFAPGRPLRLGVIANLQARGNRNGRLDSEQMRRILGRYGWLRTSRSIEETADIMGEFWGRRVDAIAVSGGDGTMSAVVTEAIHRWRREPPPFLPLPGGTANNLARWLGHLGSQAATLRRFVRGLSHGAMPVSVHRLRTLRISDPRRPRDAFGFVFGNGLVWEYDRRIHESGGPTRWNVLRSLACLSLRALLDRSAVGSAWRGRPAEIDVDGTVHRFRAFKTMIACAAIAMPSYFRPFPLPAPFGSDRFTYLMNGMERLSLFRNLLAILRGRCGSPEHHTGHGRRLAVRAEGGYMLDGELWPQSADAPVTVSSGAVIRLWSAG